MGWICWGQNRLGRNAGVISLRDHGSEHWLWLLIPWCVMALIATLLIFGHAVMAYSDPNHWLFRAMKLAVGEPQARRVLLFPLYLIGALKVVGPDWVFLANLPWVLLLALANGLLVSVCLPANVSRAQRHAGIALGMLLLTVFTYSTLIRCLNPYRETGAFALLMGGTLLFLLSDRAACWWSVGLAGLAGLCLTLSMGFRETTVLSFLPLAVWALVRFVRAPRKRSAWCGALLLGGLLGLMPFLVQNYLYSGNPLIPGYSARLVVEQASPVDAKRETHIEERLQDVDPKRFKLSVSRLVPGMELANFAKTAPQAWAKLNARIGCFGLLIAGAGIILALYRRQAVLLSLILPSLLINYVFYCFYFYVKWRYFFIVDIYIALLAAYAVTGLWDLLAACLKIVRPRWAYWAYPTLMACHLVGAAIWSTDKLDDQDAELKVWDIEIFRSQVKPLLKEPWSFVGYYHHREMLAWFLGYGFQRTSWGDELSVEGVAANGLDEELHRVGTNALSRIRNENFYFHNKQHMPRLLPLWCDVEEIVDLKNVRPYVYHYGRPLSRPLYRVCPWQSDSISVSLQLPNPGKPTVLLLDVMRPWDYADRTMLALRANGQPWLEHVGNGTQFHEIPSIFSDKASLTLELHSDAPTPANPGVRLWSANDDIDLAFGFRSKWRFHDFVSTNLYSSGPLRTDCWLLWDHGELRLPVFADTNRRACVEFALEFYQEDSRYKNTPQFLKADTDFGTQRWLLPKARQMGTATFALGRGTGSLDWRSVKLHTSLLSYEDQFALSRRRPGFVLDWSFVKLYNARIFTVPCQVELPWVLTVGAKSAGAWLVRGFYLPDKHEGRFPVRWTNGRGVIRLPEMTLNAEATCKLHFLAGPGAAGEPMPAVTVGDQDCALIRVAEDDEPWTCAVYAIPAVDAKRGDGTLLEIESTPWKPSERLNSPDSRELGIMLYQVEIAP